MGEHFCLKWNNYRNSLTAAFKSLRESEEFVDMTLSAEGTNLKAHKVVLSACSPYFRELLSGIAVWQHPVLFLRDIPLHDLALILEFVYLGEVSVSQAMLQSFLKTASLLRIRGLAEEAEEEDEEKDVFATKRKRKPSKPDPGKKRATAAAAAGTLEEIHLRKRKLTAAGSGGGGGIDLEPTASKMLCSTFVGGAKNGAADLLGSGGGGGSGDELMLKQEPLDPGNGDFPVSIKPFDEMSSFADGLPLSGADISGEACSTSGDKDAGGGTAKDAIEGTVTCLVCRAVLSNTNALYYHMNYVHSTGVQTMDLIRKMTQGEVKVKAEED